MWIDEKYKTMVTVKVLDGQEAENWKKNIYFAKTNLFLFQKRREQFDAIKRNFKYTISSLPKGEII